MAKTDLLSQLIDIDKSAKEYGFQWSNYTSAINQIIHECAEIKEAIELNHKEEVIEEVSDSFHAVISLCLYLDIDVNKLISIAINKFSLRMDELKTIAKNEYDLENLQGQEAKLKAELWKKAKLNIIKKNKQYSD